MAKHMKAVPGLIMDADSGEGYIELPDSFLEEYGTMMAVDVLGDWIADLIDYHNRAVEKLSSELEEQIQEARRQQGVV